MSSVGLLLTHHREGKAFACFSFSGSPPSDRFRPEGGDLIPEKTVQ
ncbi:hypothetical protein HMPREF9004_1304 [Schaalia cardiffensis F0333]|uniref:Uncharacterized protein n=1 Tax=Schaalia cardiffensis F0333 TaxID=888050 RepID=N6X3L4_9ACTO|nr:hypothetical protein HMPREF9004_1304 [Schaalia cardiffensis F0333]